MPQMAPISWLILFFIFSLAFIMFNILNYYCLLNSNNSNNSTNPSIFNINNKMNNNHWKW